jgi:hypothetical protein
MSSIKAIETVYNGYRFRSRLEARYAVMFDTLGIKYEYEKEGYDLGELGLYLPDFWIAEFGCFAEVKPTSFNFEQFSKCYQLPHACILLEGTPAIRYYCVTNSRWTAEGMWTLEEAYEKYLQKECYNWTDIVHSVHKDHLWFELCENNGQIEIDASLYGMDDPWNKCVSKARSARFEFGESGIQ